MKFLVDTNVLSEVRKGPRANARVLGWFGSVDDAALYLSVLVIGELRQGVERLRRRDPPAAAKLDRWLDELIACHADRTLPVDAAVADRWGRLNVPDPIPAVDGLLAATALVHSLTLVTRNTRDVRRTGVRHLDPFA
ncbi:MAG TPA: type II toxin-antitoxin system VapC family toxin [Kofleriaceae bacterium]